MNEFIVYVNGEFVKESNAKIPFNDASFLYGDGLFETIRFDNKCLFLPEKHLARLKSGLSAMNIVIDKNNKEILGILNKIILSNSLNTGLLRLMITRGEISESPWNYNGIPNIYVKIREISPRPSSPVKVVFFPESNYPIIRFNPAIKSMNYIGNMKAKNDAETIGAYEPVFFNANNIVTECAIRNIFFINNQKLLTPSLDLGVLPGVMRNTIIELSKSLDIDVEECHINYDDIDIMDEAFISSTGIGLLPVYWESFTSEYLITKKIKRAGCINLLRDIALKNRIPIPILTPIPGR